MSASNDRTVWFITGANRGIGLGLVRYILEENERDVVFAGTRDPAKSNDLNELASKKEGRLFVLELSSESEEQAKAAAQIVKDKVGHVDVVIANAGKLDNLRLHLHRTERLTLRHPPPGIANYFGPVSTSPLHEYESHWRINTLGVVILFQSLYPLLLASPTGQPKFVPISTGGASLTNLIPLPNGPYGSSKAALNFVTKRIAQEEEKNGLIAFPLTPGKRSDAPFKRKSDAEYGESIRLGGYRSRKSRSQGVRFGRGSPQLGRFGQGYRTGDQIGRYVDFGQVYGV